MALAAGGEPHATETVIANARVLLSASFLTVVTFDWRSPNLTSDATYPLLLSHVLYSVALLWLLHFRTEHTPAFLFAVHAADTFWPTFVVYVTHDFSSPFLVFYVFVLFAAAFRWGFRATMLTAGLLCISLWVGSYAFRRGLLHPFESEHLALDPLIAQIGYVLVIGLLAGYLGQAQKESRNEERAISQLLFRTRGGAGFPPALQSVMDSMMDQLSCNACEICVRSPQGGAWRWGADRTWAGQLVVNAQELPGTEIPPFEMQTGIVAVLRRRRGLSTTCLRGEYASIAPMKTPPWVESLAHEYFFSRALVAHMELDGWTGRIILMSKGKRRYPVRSLRFLHRTIREVGPALYNLYLTACIREQAEETERAKLGRELHDGIVQALFGLEMRIYATRKQAAAGKDIGEDLRQIQSAVHDELLNLRDMVYRAQTVTITPGNFVSFMSETVDKFRRDTDIAAHFTSTMQEVYVPTATCGELARMLHEALTNVRKHSGARAVLVTLTESPTGLSLSIEDDGGGFDFEGRMSLNELEASGRGPAMIRRSARTIGADLVIESFPWRGARVQIEVPKQSCSATA